MTLSELTNELKVELLNASDATYDENMWLSIEEIHRIRIGISKIDIYSSNMYENDKVLMVNNISRTMVQQ